MKRVYILIQFCFLLNALHSIQPLVRNFSKYDYRSGTQNWAITQDENNIMYFANNNGLLVFDGKNWLTVPISNGTNVRSVVYGNDGKIFASTFNEFGFFKKGDNGKFEFYSLTNKKGVYSNTPNELFSIHKLDKTIFFQGNKSIYKYNANELKKISFNYDIDASAVVHNIFFVACKEQGLFMLNGNLFVKIPGSEILENKKVCSIIPYKENKLLIVTSFDGVFIYDGISITSFNTGIDNFLKSNQVFCATTNGKQIVYGTVQRGIAIQNIENQNIMFINTFSGLQNNTVLSAAFDNQQNLWLGLDKGIDYVMFNSPVLNLFGSNNLYGAGYSSLLKNDKLYFGTNQGLYYTSYPIKSTPVPLQLELIKGLEGQVWCINEIDNTLFCGDDKGAFVIHPNKTEQIEGVNGTWSFKQLRNYKDLILGCSYNGLFILKKKEGTWKLSHYLKGNFNESSPMFEEDSDGTIWFSHWQKGLFHLFLNSSLDSISRVDLYDTKKGFPSNTNNTLFRVDNEIIFSSEQGFYRYDKATDKMVSYSKWNQLFAATPSYIRLHESKSGDVWCVSGKFIGLARKQKNDTYEMDSLSYRILQSKIIVGFENFNFIDNHNLILNTEDGFSWIDTKRLLPVNSNFNIILNSVIATNNSNPNVETKHIFGNTRIKETFKHKNNSIRFEFIAPEYRNSDLVQYSFKLDNYDNTWSDFSFENTKEYNKLSRGTYTFRVRAHNLLESKESTLSYTFTILPAWYESNLAFGIYGLMILIAVFFVIMWINNRSKKGAREMEKQKEKELHEQKKQFEAETSEKKREIKELKNQQLQYELRHKSQELASSTMNLIRKNEILQDIMNNISKVSNDLKSNVDTHSVLTVLNKMERNIKQNIENDDNWKRFEENFDLVYENYLKRLAENFPDLTVGDKKLCAYLKMDLSTKDIAQLMNMTLRSVEMNRYRLRKKLNIDRDTNLGEFLQRF